VEDIAARWLRLLGSVSLAAIVVVFGIYVFGALPFGTAPAEVAETWDLRAGEFVEIHDTPEGWSWMARIREGYALAMGSLALLAATVLPVLVIVAMAWFRRGDRFFGLLGLLITAVLVFAATGILSGGAH
jgi:hypothetical protein